MKKQKGFTLIEIMVVLVIISVLTGMVAVNVLGSGDEAKRKAAKTDFSTLSNALDMYYLHVGSYPSTNQGLAALMSAPGGLSDSSSWNGPYLKREAKDPWGTVYDYFSDGGSDYEIVSYGADGAEGGTGPNADLSSNNL